MASDASKDGRALIVANEAVSGRELRESLLAYLGGRGTEVFVVAPALATSALHHYMGDIDDAIDPAAERLATTLAELRDAGIRADGEVGDSDPMVAIADEIQKFRPDRVLLVAHTDEEGEFAEKGLLEQAQRDLDLPVTELIVDRGSSEPHVLDVKRVAGPAGRDTGWRPTGNWPPLSARNVGGILVAVIGTIVLALLAADCADNHDGDAIFGVCAARILIAIGLSLINLAHVVGLMLFQSTGYDGLWSRFFSRLSLYGTPAAIVVSLGLGLWM